jgi:hypothetical protein
MKLTPTHAGVPDDSTASHSRWSDRNIAVAMISAAAMISLMASVYLFLSGDQLTGIFVGIWVPSVLSFGTLLSGVEAVK